MKIIGPQKITKVLKVYGRKIRIYVYMIKGIQIYKGDYRKIQIVIFLSFGIFFVFGYFCKFDGTLRSGGFGGLSGGFGSFFLVGSGGGLNI